MAVSLRALSLPLLLLLLRRDERKCLVGVNLVDFRCLMNGAAVVGRRHAFVSCRCWYEDVVLQAGRESRATLTLGKFWTGRDNDDRMILPREVDEGLLLCSGSNGEILVQLLAQRNGWMNALQAEYRNDALFLKSLSFCLYL